MENFNGSLNGEEQKQTSVGKGITFAIIGMLIGLIPFLILCIALGESWWYVGGAAVGFCTSIGWNLGKGPTNGTRRIVMILLSILGGITAVILGYAWSVYDLGIGNNFMEAVELTVDTFFNGFEDIFGLHGQITFDALGAALIAVIVSWKQIDFNAGGEDLEELDNELEDVSTNDPVSASTEMEDVLNQDVPTLNDDVLNQDQDVPTLDID